MSTRATVDALMTTSFMLSSVKWALTFRLARLKNKTLRSTPAAGFRLPKVATMLDLRSHQEEVRRVVEAWVTKAAVAMAACLSHLPNAVGAAIRENVRETRRLIDRMMKKNLNRARARADAAG